MAIVKPIFQEIAGRMSAIRNCIQTGNSGQERNHRDSIEFLCREFLPSGSGFDNGTEFDFEKSSSNRLVFNVGFHHMNQHGCYDGWTQHSVIVTPDLCFGFEFRISGRNRNDIKDYIAEIFHSALKIRVEAHWNSESGMTYTKESGS